MYHSTQSLDRIMQYDGKATARVSVMENASSHRVRVGVE
jgi:hypothetical protein